MKLILKLGSIVLLIPILLTACGGAAPTPVSVDMTAGVNTMVASFYDHYQRAGRLKKPTLLFWGRNDNIVPFEHSKDILAALPHTALHALENCGHIPHYEKPQVVNPILVKFLRS